MCGYDNGLSWYELDLERSFIAQEHGFETYEEYCEAMKEDEGNRQYDEWKDKQCRWNY